MVSAAIPMTEIFLPNTLKAGFETKTGLPQRPCPISGYQYREYHPLEWNFGNGQTSSLQQPPSILSICGEPNYTIPVTLTITNDIGCQSTATVPITILDNCYIAVPTAFTPNNDGLNDFLARSTHIRPGTSASRRLQPPWRTRILYQRLD